MKLVIATPLYPPEIGGPATHTLFLERALPARGIEVETIPFAPLRRWPKGIRHVLYALNLWRAVRRANVLFAQDTVSVGLPALLAATLARVPLLVRVPGDHAWEQARARYGVTDSIEVFQDKRYGWRIELLRRIARAVVRHANLVVVPSEYFKRIVDGWVTRRQSTRVIYNGVDLAIVPVRPPRVPPRPFFVSVGRLVPWKGFGELIELVARMSGWTLVIVGDGPLRNELMDQVRAHGITDRVIFTGNLSRAEVAGWLGVSDAFVLNSSFESFSYQVVEAMGAPVPVIAPAIGSIPELIHDGVEGVLIKPGDLQSIENALRSVHADSALWRGRTDAARRAAARFSAEVTAEAFARAIREVAR